MSTRPEWCYGIREATLQGNTDHSVQEQGMGQANRDVRVNMLWSCGYFTLLFPFLSFPPSPPAIRLSPHCSLIQQQMMQQQAALMAATQGSYLNPMAAIAAAQMQQMAAFNVNGLVATPMTPSSGICANGHTRARTNCHRCESEGGTCKRDRTHAGLLSPFLTAALEHFHH